MDTALLDDIITDLGNLSAPTDAVNMYAFDGSPGNAQRRANLHLALQLALARGPDLLLIGEAPGHHGARRTGVPFTSERLLLAGVAGLAQFGAERGFALATADGRISAEQTATIAYRELAGLGLFALGWNTYPLHPHRPGNSESNRPPRSAEIALGLPFLARVVALCPDVPLVAMGRVAAQALTTLGLEHTQVRHPAQGGANEFAAGLRAFAAARRSLSVDDPA